MGNSKNENVLAVKSGMQEWLKFPPSKGIFQPSDNSSVCCYARESEYVQTHRLLCITESTLTLIEIFKLGKGIRFEAESLLTVLSFIFFT
jgi:hypothetical protein